MPSSYLFYLHLDPKHKISSSYLTTIPSSVGAMEQSSKQKVEREIMPADLFFSKASIKNPSSTSIFMYLYIVIPYPS